MAENYLITGYWGVPHVTSENDRGINAAIFGAGRFVLPVGEQFRAEYIGNNTVRIYDGKLIDNGAVAGIPAGEYIDLLIPEAGQGMNRNDLIIFQYSQDTSTLIESGVFMVLSGEETSGTASDPVLSQQDILTNVALLDQMAMWRVPVSGANISAPVQLFEVSKNIKNASVFIGEATSSDGVAYSATIPGVYELYAGLEIVIIPQLESTSETITIDVNGLGAKNVRLPLSSNTTTLVMPAQPNYYTAGRPVKLRYDAAWLNKGAWVVAERQRTSANDLYGTVPVKNGGTGADNAEEALANLGAAPAGYGLGVFPKDITADKLDTTTSNGWYRLANQSITVGGYTYPDWYVHVVKYNNSYLVQEMYTLNGYKAVRICNNGTWYDEWENPPMEMGVEYRTTKRHNGKAVYVKALDLGKLPSSGDKSVMYSNTAASIVSIDAYSITSSGTVYTFPTYNSSGALNGAVSASSYNLFVTAYTDMSARTGFAIVRYTKD